MRHGFQFLFNWTIHPLPLTDISQLQYEEIQPAGVPAFYRGTLQVDQPADTFLDMEGWTKGVVFLNGFNLGRYWSKGPQRRLYVPGPLLRQGENELVIFELHGSQEPAVMFADTSMLEF